MQHTFDELESTGEMRIATKASNLYTKKAYESEHLRILYTTYEPIARKFNKVPYVGIQIS